jgi:hypothetical protein
LKAGWKDAGVASCSAMAHEGSMDGLDAGAALLVEKLGLGVRGRTVWFAGASGRLDPLVWGVLWAEWGRMMVELLEGSSTC